MSSLHGERRGQIVTILLIFFSSRLEEKNNNGPQAVSLFV